MERPLVGRDGELARVRSWLADRVGGSVAAPPMLFLNGEAGVGKTVLIHAALDGLNDVDIRRSAGRPWQTRPFGLIRDIIGSDWNHAADTDTDTVRAALLSSGRPVVVVVDDLHWSDAASLDLLTPFVDAVAHDPVAVIGAYRGDELPRAHLLRRVRAQLRQRRLVAEVALGPLSDGALSQLIESVLGGVPAPVLTAAVAERTEGLPFFVEELLAALIASHQLMNDGEEIGLAPGGGALLPESIRDAVALRVSGLDPDTRSALDVAAVCGVEVDATLVADITGRSWPDELDHCGLLVLTAVGDRQFRHVLVQESLRDEVPWSRRRMLHLAIAERLAGVTDTEVAVARHLLAGHDLEQARPALVAAALTQMHVRAYRDAAQLLSAAIESWPDRTEENARQRAVNLLAQCWELCGEHADAIVSLRELSHVADRPAIQQRLASQYELLGQWPAALAARKAAAEALRATGAFGDSAAEQLAIAAHLRSAASFQAALEALNLAKADALAAQRADIECRVDALRGNVLARMGRPGEGVESVEAALGLALASGFVMPAAEIYQRLADSIEHSGNYRSALHAYDEAYAFCRAHDQGSAGQLCRACATVVLFNSGRWDSAIEVSREVVDDTATAPHARAVAWGVTGLVLAMRGRNGPARSALLDSHATATRIELVAMELLATWGLALLDEASGRTERARQSYRQAVLRCTETDERHYCVPILQFAAARFAVDGAAEDLAATIELLADAVARTGQPEARAGLSYALGEAALSDPGTSSRRAGLTHLTRAVDEVSQLDLPLIDALIQQRTGVAVAQSDPAASVRLLRNAYRITQRLRARTMSTRIAADIERLGYSRASRRDPIGLTPREGEVLRLVGDGLTNRQIADRLHLSVRTVEMHVSNAAAALGCRTRAEAVRRLATADPDGLALRLPRAGGATLT
jgi:DNA-binding CsgD family transcriptional regulator/tetratricopeptide (TPR) repeat protein